MISFLGYGFKDIQEIQRDVPQKKFLETLSLFSLGKMPEKGGNLPKLDRSRNVTGRVSLIQSFFSLEVKAAREQIQGFQKLFWEISLCIC